MGWQACITKIKETAGVDFDDEDLAAILGTILDRKRRTSAPRLSEAEAFKAAGAELGAEAQAAARIARRNAIENLKKRVARRAFYDAAPTVRNPATGKATPAVLMGIEAKLAGINSPMNRGRLSVDAQGRALERDYIVGLGVELQKQGLVKAFRDATIEREWARELAELNKPDGKPGLTNVPAARQVAEIVRAFQKLAVDDLNGAGAWIGEYDGYIARQSHDPDMIRRAGFDKWRDDIAPRLDERTFEGIEDRDKFLRSVHDALVTGVHMTVDGAQGFKDPAFKGPANLAERFSQARLLHFKDADAWLDYHNEYGRGTLAEAVLSQLGISAKSTALMREFGTNPRAEFDADLRYLEEKFRRAGDNDTVLKIGDRRTFLDNLFAELDGTAQTPKRRTVANIGRGLRAAMTFGKLGGVLFSQFSDLPYKAAELKYHGVGLLARHWNNIESIGHAFRSDERRELYGHLRAGYEGMWGHLAQRFDAHDTLPGTIAKAQAWFFQMTGARYWDDAQRAGAERLMSLELGRQKAVPFGTLKPESRRLLDLFGIDEARWDLLRSAEWHKADGETYLTPDIVDRIADVRLQRHLRATGAIGKRATPEVIASKVAGLRRDMELQLLSYFGDRSDFAILLPGARERALLRLGTRPGTFLGEWIRSATQFKAWSVTAISKAQGRELYGYGADRSLASRIGGVTLLALQATAIGYISRALKDAARGLSPRPPNDPAAWMDAFVYGGGLGIYGDFLMGEYGRDRSLVANVAGGPIGGTVDDLADLWTRMRAGDDVAASALRFTINNAPFINLFYTRLALDYLFLYQVQEALNPGFLHRYEQNIRRKTGQHFYLSPAAAIPYGGGDRLFEGVR